MEGGSESTTDSQKVPALFRNARYFRGGPHHLFCLRLLLLGPDSLRRWKGAPLSLNEIKNLPAVPQYRQMALFGMTEQKSIDLSGRK
jgi:hypothetical protein